MIYIGVDPGLKGGLFAMINDNLHRSVMPTTMVKNKQKLDERKIAKWFEDFAFSLDSIIVTIELVHAMPKQGGVSMFTFGMGYGIIQGICLGLEFPYQLVRPQEWQKEMLKGQPKGSEYLVASRLWPEIDWRATERSKKPHDGMVDAALICEYGRRTRREE